MPKPVRRRMTPDSVIPHPSIVEEVLTHAEEVWAERDRHNPNDVMVAGQIITTMYAAWRCS